MHPEDFRRHAPAGRLDGRLPARRRHAARHARRRARRHPPPAPRHAAAARRSRSRRLFADFRSVILPGHDPLEPPGLVRLLPVQQQPAVDPGRDAHRHDRRPVHVWQTSPAATELEQVVMDWLRQMIGLPADVHRRHPGHGLDRDAGGPADRPRARDRGPPRRRAASRPPAPPLTVYASREAHSSVDKAVKLAGFGLEQLRRIETDARVSPCAPTLWRGRSRPTAPAGARAGLRRRHRRARPRPRRSIRCRPIAEICRRHGIWLHVDAAYAGAAAIVPELRPLFDGIERGRQHRLQPAQVAADELRLLGVLRARPGRPCSRPSRSRPSTSAPPTTPRWSTSGTGGSSWAAGSARSSSGS